MTFMRFPTYGWTPTCKLVETKIQRDYWWNLKALRQAVKYQSGNAINTPEFIKVVS